MRRFVMPSFGINKRSQFPTYARFKLAVKYDGTDRVCDAGDYC